MKVWIRRFKSTDVVLAETEEDAACVDQSEAADAMELKEVEELTAEQFAKMHPSWRDVMPAGTPDCDTLAEIFERQSSGQPQGLKDG